MNGNATKRLRATSWKWRFGIKDFGFSLILPFKAAIYLSLRLIVRIIYIPLLIIQIPFLVIKWVKEFTGINYMVFGTAAFLLVNLARPNLPSIPSTVFLIAQILSIGMMLFGLFALIQDITVCGLNDAKDFLEHFACLFLHIIEPVVIPIRLIIYCIPIVNVYFHMLKHNHGINDFALFRMWWQNTDGSNDLAGATINLFSFNKLIFSYNESVIAYNREVEHTSEEFVNAHPRAFDRYGRRKKSSDKIFKQYLQQPTQNHYNIKIVRK